MRASDFVAVLFAAGVLAAPVKPIIDRDIVTEETVDVVTVYVTVGGPTPAKFTGVPISFSEHYHRQHPTHSLAHSVKHSTSAKQSPVPTSQPVQTSAPKPKPTPSSPVVESSSTTEETPAATSQPSDGSPLSAGVSYLTTINKWRSAYSLNTLKWSSKLAANAQKTGTDDGGVNENHELNSGSMAQVITPGQQVGVGDLEGESPFEIAYVGWLCEVPSDPELSANGVDQCALVKQVLNLYYTETGHHDILTSTSYSEIGCYFAPNPAANDKSEYQGLYVCDLA